MSRVQSCIGCGEPLACPECGYIAAASPDVALATLRAERDEALREIAAFQGRPDGALNEHWRPEMRGTLCLFVRLAEDAARRLGLLPGEGA